MLENGEFLVVIMKSSFYNFSMRDTVTSPNDDTCLDIPNNKFFI